MPSSARPPTSHTMAVCITIACTEVGRNSKLKFDAVIETKFRIPKANKTIICFGVRSGSNEEDGFSAKVSLETSHVDWRLDH